MRAGLDKLKEQVKLATEKLDQAERLGMEVREPRFRLREANDALKNARTVIHRIATKPLISRKGWTAIILGVIAICLLSMIPLGDAVQSTESLVPQEWIPNYQFSLPEIPVIPKAAWTGILAFGVFALVHLYWMKYQLTRQGML